jgi:hypothetical protein
MIQQFAIHVFCERRSSSASGFRINWNFCADAGSSLGCHRHERNAKIDICACPSYSEVMKSLCKLTVANIKNRVLFHCFTCGAVSFSRTICVRAGCILWLYWQPYFCCFGFVVLTGVCRRTTSGTWTHALPPNQTTDRQQLALLSGWCSNRLNTL